MSKDIAFGPSAVNSAKTDQSEVNINSQPLTAQPDTSQTVAKVNVSEKAIEFGNVQNQITSFTGQLVANSWKLITVLPKPQLDSSLLDIGSNSPFKQNKILSFSPRLTLGNIVEPISPIKVSSSLSTSLLFTFQRPTVKILPALNQWNQSVLYTKPWNMANSNLDKLNTYKGFFNLNRFEASTKPFNIMTFLAVVNTSTLSSGNFGTKNY